MLLIQQMIKIENYETYQKYTSNLIIQGMIKHLEALKYAHSSYLIQYWVSKRELKVTKKGMPKIFL